MPGKSQETLIENLDVPGKRQHHRPKTQTYQGKGKNIRLWPNRRMMSGISATFLGVAWATKKWLCGQVKRFLHGYLTIMREKYALLLASIQAFLRFLPWLCSSYANLGSMYIRRFSSKLLFLFEIVLETGRGCIISWIHRAVSWIHKSL